MPGDPIADEVWRTMSALVLENKDAWRRSVVELTGLPFSRIRILKRLDRHPMTVKQVAEAATIDAPAATVAVNDLEARGLVVREINPENRRAKVGSLTTAGPGQPAGDFDPADDGGPRDAPRRQRGGRPAPGAAVRTRRRGLAGVARNPVATAHLMLRSAHP